MNFCISSLIVCSISKTSTTVSTDLSIALYRIFSSSEINLTLCHVKRLPRKTSRALILLDCRHYQLKLLNDSSNSTRTYSTSTFTLPVLDLSLSSTMLFVDFMLFLGTTYIMYFYFPKLLEPFWSHLNSSTSTSICLSFYCNNSYEN